MRILPAGPVTRLAFSPDGRFLLIEGEGQVWELPAWKQRVASLPGPGAFVPDDVVLCLAYNQSLARIDFRTGDEVPPRVGVPSQAHPSWLLSTPDRSRVLRVGVYSSAATLLWLSWPGMSPLDGWSAEDPPVGTVDVAFTPAGDVVVLDERPRLQRIDSETGRQRWKAGPPVVRGGGTVACSPDGRFVALVSGVRLHVLDAADGRPVHELRQASRHFLGAAFTPDGRYLATVSHERTVKFFDTSSWQLCHELAWQIGGLRAVAFSPDGMLAAAGGAGKKVVVWDLDL